MRWTQQDADDLENMWGYWIEKYGHVRAIEQQYPHLLQDPVLAVCIAQIKAAKLGIDGRIAQLQRGPL